MNEDNGATLNGDRPVAGAVRPFVSELRVRNYKSIGQCRVALKPLTVVVGRNGAGKSNFLDSLRFVADALNTSLDHALKSRGGIEDVRRRSTGHPWDFAIGLTLSISNNRSAEYGFEIGTERTATRDKRGRIFVKNESLVIRNQLGMVIASYKTDRVSASVTSSITPMPAFLDDRLYLVAASSIPQFRDVYDSLRSMGFYNLNPEVVRELQSADAGELLHRDGANIASVVARLQSERPQVVERVKQFLNTITPGIVEFSRVPLGPRETLEFRQNVAGAKAPWRFYAANMSDGTLRAIGILVAVSQLAGHAQSVRLVGIEEPETALHPAAAGALMDAIREAGQHTQVVITTHSPDLLDTHDFDADCLLIAIAEEGETKIAPADPASLQAVTDHLYGVGELHRMDQLQPDRSHLIRQAQATLFDWS